MKTKSTVLYLLILLPLITYSQGVADHCGFDNLQAQLQEEDANYFDRLDGIELDYLNFVSASSSLALYDSITLPVVIHVVHLPGTLVGTEENITDEEVRLGLQRLNNTFAGNACDDNPTGNNMNIKFELARRNILGEETNGIIRHSSTFSQFGFGGYSFMIFDAVGFASPFPTTDYINIYLVKSICYTMVDGECSGPLGLATSAPSHGMIADGIAIESGIWINEDECYSGKLAAHEMGHYLNLLHTFENGCPNDNCLTQGDRVCDTAPDNSSDRNNETCQTGIFSNSCSTELDDEYCNVFTSDVPDPEDNIMDYSSFACQYLFTDGQKVRMHATLRTTRNSLIRSDAFINPCDSVITTQILGEREVLIDSVETYLSNATNADSIAWLVDSVFVSNEINLEYAFTEVGEHILTLQAFNNLGCKYETYRNIKVFRTDCNLTAQISEPPIVCNSFSTGFIRLNALPSGGEWELENGQRVDGSFRSELYTGGLQSGTYALYYTIQEDWCQQTFETELTIAESFLDVTFTGEVDCSNPTPNPIEMSIFTNDSGLWYDNQGNQESFNGVADFSISKGGTFDFEMFTVSDICRLSYEVPSSPPLPVLIEPCNDCQPNVSLCVNSAIENTNINWYGGYPWSPGNWEAIVIDNNNGCESWTNMHITSLENLNPSCSAGSTSGIYCGKSKTLLGAITSLEGDIEYWWTTTDGNIIADSRTLTPTIDRPGTYSLHARNNITGCEDIDMVTVNPLTKNKIISESICLGDIYEGYTESGTYVDTFTYACDCDSIRTLNLEVFQTEINSEITNAEGDENNGSIEILDIEGNAPFSFLWSTGETTQDINDLATDTYFVIITDDDGCETTFDFFVDVASSIQSVDENINITFSPNPVSQSDKIKLRIESTHTGKYSIKIYDLLGRKIEDFIHPHFSETTTAEFSLYQSGLYIINIESDQIKNKALKLVVRE